MESQFIGFEFIATIRQSLSENAIRRSSGLIPNERIRSVSREISEDGINLGTYRIVLVHASAT